MAKFTDDYLLFLLAQASAAASASFHNSLAQQGVAVSTWRILASLYPDDAMTISELAHSCMAKQPTMTRMIDRLAAEGIVVRVPAKTDKRRVLVRLTDAGREKAATLVAAAKIDESEALAGYTAEERATLKATLRRLQRS
ncbi:MAG: MarR family winged helix-turn-helix transcriptional regulator [Pikeienuella sp.]